MINNNTDTEGYLLNLADWSPDWAINTAQADGLRLTTDHWNVINFVRDYYNEYQSSPAIRALIKAMKPSFGDNANSIYLQSLFPKGAAKQIAKIAGLPKPAKCI